MKNAFSIRFYLLLLVLGTIVPFIGLHIFLAYRTMQQQMEVADQTLAMLANIAAGDTRHFLYDGKTALQRIAAQPAIRSLKPDQCDASLQLFTCVNPNFCSISVVTASEKLVCSEAASSASHVDVLTDKRWLKSVLSTRGFVVSEPFMDKLTSRRTIVFGYPIEDTLGKVTGAIAIAVDLLDYDSVHYKSALENAHLPPGSVVTIVDSMGYVVARWPNANHWVGKKANDAEIVHHILSESDNRIILAHGMDGVEKLYHDVAIPDTDWHLYIGIPAALITAPAHALMYRTIFLGIATLVIAALLAAYFSGLIRQPLLKLSGAVAAATHGDIGVRVSTGGPREFVEVGKKFNEMLVARARAEDALAKEKEQAEVTLASIGDAVIRTDASGNITYLNSVAEGLTGWHNGQAHGQHLFDVVKLVDSTTQLPFQKSLEQALNQGYLVSMADTTVLVRRDGQEFPVADCAAPIRDQQGTLIGSVLVFRDISKARELSAKLSWNATHDSLTGLYNRREFENRLAEAIATSRRRDALHAVLYLDLDQFKIVNDTCGHGAGDELLRRLASLLQTDVRGYDTLARLGGDEFGVLLEDCPLDQALRVADEFRESVHDFRFVWEGKTFLIGVSIGVVPITRHSESLQQVLSSVDAACYVAKEKGRNRVHVFQPDDLDLAQRLGEMNWVQRISEAFEQDRYRLYCQTILPLHPTTAATRWGEILIRMVDEKGEILLPDSFMRAAERYNLMPVMDRWVVRTLFNRLISRPNWQSDRNVYSVNISGATLGDEHFLDFVIDQFTQTNISPALICFEITETAAIINFPQATRFMTILKSMGCRLALDDFGSGISSFGYLKTLPVDYLKIAGHFVADIESDPVDGAMVEAMNHVGHIMRLNTIAEYVENDGILTKLKNMGVDFAQGNGVGYPLELDEWLAEEDSVKPVAPRPS